MELVCAGVSPLQPGPPPYPYGKPTPLFTNVNSCFLVTYGVSQLAAEPDPRAAVAELGTRCTPGCSRTVLVSPITPSTPPAIVAGSWTAVELAKYSVPCESR